MQNFKIYKASAGSGKTHTIVSEYLKLALEDVNSFQSVLAVTFTNKVARELKYRIISVVHAMSQNNFDPISIEIMNIKNWDAKELSTRAQMLLENILQDYDSFQVSTIDSFFQKLIIGFDMELALKPGFCIELDPSAAKKNIISTIINKVQIDKQLKNWLIKLAEEKLREGKSWEIEKDILLLCSTLFTESKLLNEKNLPPYFIADFIKNINETIKDFELESQAAGKKILDLIKDNNLKVEDFAYSKAGVMGYIEKLSNKKISEPKKRVYDAAENPWSWTTKNSIKKEKIHNLASEKLIPLLQNFLLLYSSKSCIYKSAHIAKRFMHILGIKSEMKEELENYKNSNNILFIPDATLLSHFAIKNHTEKELQERLGCSYTNFFIDEFQDISFLQWECFLPLIQRSIKKNHTSMVVGDIKQSIYRWRNSDWHLLNHIISQNIKNSEIINLHTNWRSRRNIVFFNNTFFSIAASLLEETLQKKIEEIENTKLRMHLSLEAINIKNAYNDVKQTLPENCVEKNHGYVEISFLENEKENNISWKEKAKIETISLIEKLQEESFTAGKIAILVRNHKEGREIFEAIAQKSTSAEAKPHCNYAVVSASSFCLGHNIWVNLIVSAMKYILNSENSLISYEFSHFYNLCMHSQKNKTSTNKKNQETIHDPSKYFSERIKSLHSYPIITLVDSLVNIFEIEGTEHLPFLERFQDLILEFSKKTTSLEKFISWWEEKGKTSILAGAENTDAIKILTIHQSKGLQFGVVIIPFCDWDFDHSALHAPLLWCDANEKKINTNLSHNLNQTLDKNSNENSNENENINISTEISVEKEKQNIFENSPLLPMLYSSKMKSTVFEKDYYEEQMQSHLDNFNLLYVALTRAEERMYLFSKKSSYESIKSIADLLYSTLLKKKISQGESIFPNWQSFWNLEKNIFTIGAKSEQPKKILNPLKKIILSTNIGEKSNISHNTVETFHFPHSKKNESGWVKLFEKSIKKTNTSEIVLGDIIHTLIAQIFTLKDLETTLEKIKSIPISEEEKITLHQIFLNFCENKEVQAWYDGSWLHRIEAPLLNNYGKILRPDRVILKKEKIIVIDFKTGLNSPSHIKQVKEYTEAISSMYPSANVDGLLAYLHVKETKMTTYAKKCNYSRSILR